IISVNEVIRIVSSYSPTGMMYLNHGVISVKIRCIIASPIILFELLKRHHLRWQTFQEEESLWLYHIPMNLLPILGKKKIEMRFSRRLKKSKQIWERNTRLLSVASVS